MNALAGLLNPLQVGQMVQSGFQQGREMRAGMETENALSKIAMNPEDQEARQSLARFNPKLAIEMQEKDAERKKAAQQADIQRRAAMGDPQAQIELAGVDFNAWKGLRTDQRAAVEQEAKIFGNAAMDILQTPDASQRMAKIQGYAQQLGGQYPEVAQIAQLPPDQLEAALRSAVAEAQMVEKLIALEQPRYQVIPEGGTLVNTRDPGAVAQFGQGAPQAAGAPSNGNVLTMEMYRGAVNGLGPQGAAAWLQRNGTPVAVSTPQEARQLPSGTRIVLPDGSEGRVP